MGQNCEGNQACQEGTGYNPFKCNGNAFLKNMEARVHLDDDLAGSIFSSGVRTPGTIYDVPGAENNDAECYLRCKAGGVCGAFCGTGKCCKISEPLNSLNNECEIDTSVEPTPPMLNEGKECFYVPGGGIYGVFSTYCGSGSCCKSSSQYPPQFLCPTANSYTTKRRWEGNTVTHPLCIKPSATPEPKNTCRTSKMKEPEMGFFHLYNGHVTKHLMLLKLPGNGNNYKLAANATVKHQHDIGASLTKSMFYARLVREIKLPVVVYAFSEIVLDYAINMSDDPKFVHFAIRYHKMTSCCLNSMTKSKSKAILEKLHHKLEKRVHESADKVLMVQKFKKNMVKRGKTIKSNGSGKKVAPINENKEENNFHQEIQNLRKVRKKHGASSKEYKKATEELEKKKSESFSASDFE